MPRLHGEEGSQEASWRLNFRFWKAAKGESQVSLTEALRVQSGAEAWNGSRAAVGETEMQTRAGICGFLSEDGEMPTGPTCKG